MISRKLRSRAGASLIAALFLFLLCAMAGSTILAAATANAGRIANRRTENQAYYKTISAARLFADKLSGQKITVTWTLDYATGNYLKPTVTSEKADGFAVFLRDTSDEIFQNSVTTDADKNWDENFGAFSPDPERKDFTVSLSDKDASTVYGRISLQCVGGYLELQAVFSSGELPTDGAGSGDSGATSGDKSYRVYLKSLADRKVESGEVFNETTGDITGETKTMTFTWPDGIKVKER